MKKRLIMVLCTVLLITMLTGCDDITTFLNTLLGSSGVKTTITTDINIDGFTIPKVGETAVKADDLKLNSEECKIKDIQWYDNQWFDEANDDDLKTPVTFESGKAYYAKITLKANDGFAFPVPGNSEDAEQVKPVKVTINGTSDLVCRDGRSEDPENQSSDTLDVFTVSFSMYDKAEVLEVVMDAPKAGDRFDDFEEAKLILSGGDNAKPVSIPVYLVLWSDEYDEKPEGDCFKPGKYRLRINFEVPEHWPLSVYSFTPTNTTIKTCDEFEYQNMTHYAERNVGAFFTVTVGSQPGTLSFELPKPQPGTTAKEYLGSPKVEWLANGSKKAESLNATNVFFCDPTMEIFYDQEFDALKDGQSYAIRLMFSGCEHWDSNALWSSEPDSAKRTQEFLDKNNITVKVSDGVELDSIEHYAETAYAAIFRFSTDKIEESLEITLPKVKAGDRVINYDMEDIKVLWTNKGTDESKKLELGLDGCYWQLEGGENLYGGVDDNGNMIDNGSKFEAGKTYSLQVVFFGCKHWMPNNYTPEQFCEKNDSVMTATDGYTIANIGCFAENTWYVNLKFTVPKQTVTKAKTYKVKCTNCTFTGGGYTDAKSGSVPKGTVITVTADIATRAPSSWSGSNKKAGTAGSFTYTVNGNCSFTANYDEIPGTIGTIEAAKSYRISCLDCTFTGGGYTNATSGTVLEGTEITVTADIADRAPSSWSGAYNAGKKASFRYTVTSSCRFIPNYD